MVLGVGTLLLVDSGSFFFHKGDHVKVTSLQEQGALTFVRIEHVKRGDYVVQPLDLVLNLIERGVFTPLDVPRET